MLSNIYFRPVCIGEIVSDMPVFHIRTFMDGLIPFFYSSSMAISTSRSVQPCQIDPCSIVVALHVHRSWHLSFIPALSIGEYYFLGSVLLASGLAFVDDI